MFFTIGLIIGFAAGWYVNEKFEAIPGHIEKLKFGRNNIAMEGLACSDTSEDGSRLIPNTWLMHMIHLNPLSTNLATRNT